VHTPEYAFEHLPSNVAAGVEPARLTFPAARQRLRLWNAYDNSPGPRRTDRRHRQDPPRVRREGDYSGEEQLIRQLLAAAHPGRPAEGDGIPDTTPPTLSRRRRATSAPSARRVQRPAPLTRPPVHAGRHPSANTYGLSGAGPSAAVDRPAGKAGDQARVPRLGRLLDGRRTGTLTVSSGARARSSAAPAPRTSTLSPRQPAADGTVTIGLSPGCRPTRSRSAKESRD